MLLARSLVILVLITGIGPLHRGGPLSMASSPFPPLADRETSATASLSVADAGDPTLADLEARLRQLENPPAAPQPTSPTINWTGQIQNDYVAFDQTDLNRQSVGELQNGVGFRRARLGAFGDVHELIEYRIEMDFALAGRPSFLDNWIGVKEVPHLGSLRVGHFFEPFSLERVTPNRFSTFMERSLMDHFAPARNTGMMAWNHGLDGNLTAAVGLFRSDSDAFGDAVGNDRQWAGTSRVTWSPGFDRNDRRYLLHVGAAYSIRGADEGQVRFQERPEIRMAATGRGGVPSFVDTGDIPAGYYQLFGTELAIVRDSFSLQGECIYVPVSRTDQSDVAFYGMYVFASYFLTGEHRPYFRTRAPYRRNNGVFDRVIPHTNVFCGPNSGASCRPGIGAWELAVRWSHLDLNSGDVQGGRLSNVTLGMNWYLNPYTRVQWNYIRPLLDDPQFGKSTANIYAMRVGFDF